MNFNLVIVPTMYKQQKTEKCHHVKHKDTSMYKIFFLRDRRRCSDKVSHTDWISVFLTKNYALLGYTGTENTAIRRTGSATCGFARINGSYMDTSSGPTARLWTIQKLWIVFSFIWCFRVNQVRWLAILFFLHIPMVGSLVVITSRCMVLLFTVRVFTCMQC